jgi:hypothetical protein
MEGHDMATFRRAFLAALLLAGPGVALALPVSYSEITIYDGDGSGSGFAQEDQETEPGTVNDQSWDLESFISYGTSQIGIIGGYDFFNNLGGDRRPGDIFVDIDGNYIAGNAAGADGNTNVPNTFGYEYVLDIDWTSLTYDVLQLSTSSVVQTAAYGVNYGSSPWLYISGGSLLGSGYSFTGESGLTDLQTGKLGGSHNAALGFDLGFLGLNSSYVVHFTSACGNDNLMGSGGTSTLVPVPAAVWLLASALGLLAMLRRRATA